MYGLSNLPPISWLGHAYRRRAGIPYLTQFGLHDSKIARPDRTPGVGRRQRV